jgi:hypothetical protein
MTKNICLFLLICFSIFFLIFGLGLERLLTTHFGQWAECLQLQTSKVAETPEKFVEGYEERKPSDNIYTDYNLIYTADGVKDVVKIKNPKTNASIIYMDDITKLNQSYCPTGFVYDKKLGCKTECPPGMVYDHQIQQCTNQCLPFQNTTYTDNDSSASCTAKCKTIQYFDIFTKTCNNCPIGYIGDGNNNCIAWPDCPDGQKVVDNYGTCKGCPYGQTMDASFQCHDICQSYQKYDEDGTCALKCPNPNQYSDPWYGCINCPLGYLVDGSNVCQPRPPCPEGQFLDNAGIHCVSECAIYDRYDKTTGTCVPICGGLTPFYDHLAFECVPCPDGEIFSGSYNKCIPGPTPPPPTCGPGYVLSNGQCKSICPDWRVNDRTNPGTCNLLCPSRTQYFDDVISYGCLDCPSGYTVDANNTCQPPAPTTPPPFSCTGGYALNTHTNMCESVCSPWRTNDPDNPMGCKLICPLSTQRYDTTVQDCVDCPYGWSVDNNNECTIPPPPPPPTTKPPIIITNNQTTNTNNSSNSSSNSSSSSTSTSNPIVNSTSAPTSAPTPAPTQCLYKDRTNHGDDYQNTCSNYSTSSTGQITAYCKDFNSNWPRATFNSCDCKGRIQNIGGVLTCYDIGGFIAGKVVN